MEQATLDRLVALRRDLHRYPEPAWCEFYTTARIVDEIETIPEVTLSLGEEAVSPDDRMAVPESEEIDSWMAAARERGARADVLEAAAGGLTGVVAELSRGEGPTVALRVDIDGLRRTESDAESHVPAAEGFRSETGETMHACGHDAHVAIGIGILQAIAQSEFQGTFKVLFQPAEEVAGGGKPMVESGQVEDVEYFFSLHVGLDHPTGEVVAGMDDFLAVSHFYAAFEGEPAHAGKHPEAGRNAIQAMATAVQNLYAIPRHNDGATRVNAGEVGGGSATNIIPESAYIDGEVRGQTDELMAYMRERADRTLESAARMHDCSVSIETVGQAPSAESDQALVDVVHEIASAHPDVDRPVERAALGGSEDATYLMAAVQDQGGLATYVGIGTDHPGGHHTSTFDVDEASIPIGVEIVSDAILRIAALDPLSRLAE
jgi:aminobenzoyl-glutamate utilization protein A